MTTDRLSRAKSIVLSVFLVGMAWLGIAAIAGARGEFDTLLVVHAEADFWDRLPADIALVDVVLGSPVLRGDGTTLAQDLMDAGATVLLPARAKTCLAF